VSPADLPSPRSYLRHRSHIIGQERAISALELGLSLDSPGFNIYVSGPAGSGKMTTTKHILAGFKQPREPLQDYIFLHNFQEPDRPRLLMLSPGVGLKLKKALDNLTQTLKRELNRAVATEHTQKDRDRVIAAYQKSEHELVSGFQDRVRQARFLVAEVQSGPVVEHDVLPMIGDEPQPMAVLEEKVHKGELSRQEYLELEKKHIKLRTELEQVQRRTRSLARELTERLEEIDRRVGSAVIDALIEDLREQFRREPIQDTIEELREALLERIPALVRRGEEEDPAREGAPQGLPPGFAMEMAPPDPLALIQANVVLNNARQKGCPVVIEHNPTMVRLFGTIERGLDDGNRGEADFMAIRAGSLLRANGGFLVVQAEDLLTEPGVWKVLKRAVSSNQLEIRMPEGPMAMAPSALKPDPIPLRVKIIMLGDEELYRAMYMAEEDFKKTFKVKAEFDDVMELDRTNIEKLLAFVHRVVHEEGLRPFGRPALARMVEEAMREAEDQIKLSTRFRSLADLAREANYWAQRSGHRVVLPGDVEQALQERHRRFNLSEEKYQESIDRAQILVDTRGTRVGQVNGLTVFDMGDFVFGKPCRITAAVGVGRRGVVNIERESGLSGELHDKGVYILTGFLRDRFGRHQPLALEASVCFEQTYGPVDGDSASSTEVYAVLSALADLPLDQAIAVTGSVNQRGDIQPIGGVNQKIEGFFDVCQARGLTGEQGVIIPRANTPNLMLAQRVVEAVRARRFHVFAIDSIDQGMEILTGMPAGRPRPDGSWPPGTVNRRVADRLARMAEALREHR
jgi:ATP-dependent Lon protease